MNKNMAKKGLGKGLGSLLGTEAVSAVESEKRDSSSTDSKSVLYLSITDIEPNVLQPRKVFDEEALDTLAESIRKNGVLQPLVVRRHGGTYQIVVGERRWRASRKIGLDKVPAIIIEADDLHVAELALIENLQREDLNPVEEAEGYKALQEKYGLTQSEISERVGKSRSAVANTLRLLNLSEKARISLAAGLISSGHARALLPLSEAQQEYLTERIEREGLSVRQIESLSAKLLDQDEEAEPGAVSVDYIKILQNNLSERLGRRVKITSGKKKGRLELEYYGNDDLDLLISRLTSMGGE